MMKAGHLLVFLLFTLAAPALANDTAIQGVGGAVSAMEEHPSVVMEEMEVAIDLYPERAEVECAYLFRNTGPAVTVQMGFPEAGNRTEKGTRPKGFTAFRTTVDGEVAAARGSNGVSRPCPLPPVRAAESRFATPRRWGSGRQARAGSSDMRSGRAARGEAPSAAPGCCCGDTTIQIEAG